ncbi:hypothetical protein [Nostoc sp. 106C]|uniref:hypothetical protein n=1 Tax=Nostoc sp. 106C TaxID=1932667 RepID=UPI00117E5337|nr:hypothetical protein [Nostoc sp. 106C]
MMHNLLEKSLFRVLAPLMPSSRLCNYDKSLNIHELWRCDRLKAVDSNNAPKSKKICPLISYFSCHSLRRTNSFKTHCGSSLLCGRAKAWAIACHG